MIKIKSKSMGLKPSRIDQKGSSNTKVVGNKIKRLKPTINAFSAIDLNYIAIGLPLVTVSEANSSEAWPKKHKRHRLQGKTVALFLNPHRDKLKLPCEIKITRFAPRKLDKHDNLPMSVKYIVDAICAIITGDFRPGRADDEERISISYDQVLSKEYGVILEIKHHQLASG